MSIKPKRTIMKRLIQWFVEDKKTDEKKLEKTDEKKLEKTDEKKLEKTDEKKRKIEDDSTSDSTSTSTSKRAKIGYDRAEQPTRVISDINNNTDVNVADIMSLDADKDAGILKFIKELISEYRIQKIFGIQCNTEEQLTQLSSNIIEYRDRRAADNIVPVAAPVAAPVPAGVTPTSSQKKAPVLPAAPRKAPRPVKIRPEFIQFNPMNPIKRKREYNGGLQSEILKDSVLAYRLMETREKLSAAAAAAATSKLQPHSRPHKRPKNPPQSKLQLLAKSLPQSQSQSQSQPQSQ